MNLQTLRTVAHADYARLLAPGYPVLRIWETNQEGWAGEQDIRLDAGVNCLLITREATEVLLVTLGPGEHRLLQSLAAGSPWQRPKRQHRTWSPVSIPARHCAAMWPSPPWSVVTCKRTGRRQCFFSPRRR